MDEEKGAPGLLPPAWLETGAAQGDPNEKDSVQLD
jgi:hypothetical protein